MLTEGIKQNKQLYSQTAQRLTPVSEVRGCFWLRNLVGAGEEGTKGICCTPQGTDFWSSFIPYTFLDPLQMFPFLTFLPLLPVALTFSTGCEGNDTKALQTRNIPNCWFTKFKHLNFKNSYLLFICGTVSYLCNRAEALLFPSVVLTAPIPNWTSTGGGCITLVSLILTPEAVFVLPKLLEEYSWEPYFSNRLPSYQLFQAYKDGYKNTWRIQIPTAVSPLPFGHKVPFCKSNKIK